MTKRVSVTGNGHGKLAAWQKLFDNTPGLLDAISKSGADEMLGLVSEGFRNERDPYGKGWKKPKKVPDGRKMLSGKTSRLKKWQRKKADKHGFTIAPTVDYAAYHQGGTKRMVARKMVPDGSLGLPPSWSDALEETAQEACKAYFTTASAGAGMGFSPVASTIAAFKRNNLNVKALIRKLANAGEE